MKLSVGVLIAVSMGACEGVGDPEQTFLRIEPTKAQYRPAEYVTLAFRNIGTSDVIFNPCYATLQRSTDQTWIVITPSHDVPTINCPDLLRTLAPGTMLEDRAGILPPNLAAGLYRYRLDDMSVDQGTLLPEAARVSSPFRVALQ